MVNSIFRGKKMPEIIPPEGFMPWKFTTQEHYTIVPERDEGRDAWGGKEKHNRGKCVHGRK
jgi:hypothetical protein